VSDEIQTGPYEIEVADPSFCGECGQGSKTYTFDSYAEVLAFREGLDALDAEYKIVERWGEKYWAYEGEEPQVFHTKVETFVRFCIDTNYEIHARNEDEAREFSINRAQHEIKKFMEEGNVEALVPHMFELTWNTWMKGGDTTEVNDEDIRVVYVEGPVDEME
jgi:hypothetical protein